jgi:CPA1 family monovalent cation:H+ antiporter
VLAVVTTGLYIGGIRLLLSPATRIQALAVWEVVVFLLNGFIFILIGLQLPGIMRELAVYPLVRLLGWAALVSLTVIAVRYLWVFPTTYVTRALFRRLRERDPYPPWRSVFVIAWTGMRGVVSLAAAFALPFTLPGGAPFPGRDLILFLTFGVILATLVLQGMTLPAILRWLGVADPNAYRREEREARLRAANAAIARLEDLAAEDGQEPDHLERLRWRYENRSRRLTMKTDLPEMEICESISGDYERLRRDLIGIERKVIHELRDQGAISDQVMLRIDRELDLDETRVET